MAFFGKDKKKSFGCEEVRLTKEFLADIQKYIDDNFFNQKLSLEMISKSLSYSPKYISSVFKKKFNVGITEYLNTIRIQNACTLMKQGFTSISDVSNQCGFADAQYFSKVFKQRTGLSPKAYIKSLPQ